MLKKRFVLERVLGRGGMGVVYKAKDLRKVEAEDRNPYVAAKVLGRSFKDHPDAFKALQKETAISQTLAHPNIVTVHDFDRDGNTIYMTMELLEGTPLDKVLKEHKGVGLGKKQALHLFTDMCAALAYAHKRDLIHSDFKPGNVFVTVDNAAKVLDFGIARAASVGSKTAIADGQGAGSTQGGNDFDPGSLGALTPGYASLEMFQGETPCFSDDVYALACVLYEMLCGEHPYDKTPANKAIEEGLKPKRPDGLTNREWKALTKGLALKREDRWKSTEQFMYHLLPRRRSPWVRGIAATTFVAIGLAAWFGYESYQAELSVANTIAEKLDVANQCFEQGNYQCAIDNSLVVKNLAPNDSNAKALYDKSIEGLKDQQFTKAIDDLRAGMRSCFTSGDYDCASVRARELLDQLSEDAEAQQRLAEIEQIKQSQKVTTVIAQAQKCLDNQDLECATLFLDEAKAIDSAHPSVEALSQALMSRKEILAEQASERSAKISALMSSAKNCQRQQDYGCVIAKADQILAIDDVNTEAVSIKQQAILAKQQANADERTVRKILTQAQACLDRRNYSCAIAKSESALDIVPKHPSALRLRKKAEDAQAALKKSIMIN
nr:protein kinase [Marinibactrum halimedae]